jgi:hypothetical protein
VDAVEREFGDGRRASKMWKADCSSAALALLTEVKLQQRQPNLKNGPSPAMSTERMGFAIARVDASQKQPRVSRSLVCARKALSGRSLTFRAAFISWP